MRKPTKKSVDLLDHELTGDARRGDTYFITGHAATGYTWELIKPNGDALCSTTMFDTKAECLKSLRAVQRHASSTHVIDEAH